MRDKWQGGRVYTTAAGERHWTIRRQVDGVGYDIVLDAKSEADALLELRAFLENPSGYASKSREGDAVTLDAARVAAYVAHLKAIDRSKDYVFAAGHYLSQWGGALHPRDLRALDARTVKRALASWPTATKHRIIAFKAFCSYLVDRGDLDPNENPGRFLTVPSSRRTHDVKGYSIATVERLYTALPTQPVRDVLCVQAKTGMHLSEVGRLALGKGEARDVRDHGDIAGTVRFVHKTGQPKIISLDAQVLAAAKRLQSRGRAPDIHTIQDAVALACEKNSGLERVHFGALRHSFATWLAECGTVYAPKGTGLPIETVAQALGHSNTRTTRVHYLSVQVPPMYVVPIRLFHPGDPAILPAPALESRPLPATIPSSEAPQSAAESVPPTAPAHGRRRPR